MLRNQKSLEFFFSLELTFTLKVLCVFALSGGGVNDCP